MKSQQHGGEFMKQACLNVETTIRYVLGRRLKWERIVSCSSGQLIHDKDIVFSPRRKGTTSNLPSEDEINLGIISPRLSSRIRGFRALVSVESEIL